MRNWSLIADRLARDGELISVAEAAKLIPAHRGKCSHASPTALQRWIVSGKNGVYLDGVKAGRGWITTQAALLRFLVACSEDAESRLPATPVTLSSRELMARVVLERMRVARPAAGG